MNVNNVAALQSSEFYTKINILSTFYKEVLIFLSFYSEAIESQIFLD